MTIAGIPYLYQQRVSWNMAWEIPGNSMHGGFLNATKSHGTKWRIFQAMFDCR